MSYLKSKFKKKSQLEILIEEFKKEGQDQYFRDKEYLETDRIMAEAWHAAVSHIDHYPLEQISEFEQLISIGVEQQWGKCTFDFDRDQLKIFVTSYDGRAMEMVSGNIISEGVVIPSPKSLIQKPVNPMTIQPLENACNDWLTWLENTK